MCWRRAAVTSDPFLWVIRFRGDQTDFILPEGRVTEVCLQGRYFRQDIRVGARGEPVWRVTTLNPVTKSWEFVAEVHAVQGVQCTNAANDIVTITNDFAQRANDKRTTTKCEPLASG